MRIFGLGLPELLIILAIVCILFGPVLFKKLNKQVKETGKARQEGPSRMAPRQQAAMSTSTTSTRIRCSTRSRASRTVSTKMFEDDEEDEPAKTADKTSDSTQAAEKDEKPEPTKTSKDDAPSA